MKYLKNLLTSSPRDTRYYLIQYNENNFRLLKNKYQLGKGWELAKAPTIIDNIDFTLHSSSFENEAEIERCSLSRTKARIRELALCNDFEYFGTITINGYFLNRYELDECQKRLKDTLHYINRRNNRHNSITSLKYLIITEKHKDGAFHFHGLFSGLDLKLNEYGYYYSEDFSRTLGYNSFSKIRDKKRVSSYITKYITKECVKNSHNQIFLRSKGLNVATKEEIEPLELRR